MHNCEEEKCGHWGINGTANSEGGPGSVVGIATGYGLDGPVAARFSALVQTGSGAHPASCTIGTGSFPGVKSGRGVTLTSNPLLVPWSRGRAIPLRPLWAVRPVQSLSACTRAHFTYFLWHYSKLFKFLPSFWKSCFQAPEDVQLLTELSSV